MRANKNYAPRKKVEEKFVEKTIEEIFPDAEEKISTKPKRKKTLLELIEEEETKIEE